MIYATTHGHTAKIASALAGAIRGASLDVVCRDVADPRDAKASDYDAVVAGASLHAGSHQREMVDWVKANRESLKQRPSAFFSVSLAAAEDTADAHEATQECLDRFLEQTGWTPELTTRVAGCLQYLEYGPLLRLMMRLKMRRGGHPTDASRDHEYTDWVAVAGFGRLPPSPPAASRGAERLGLRFHMTPAAVTE